MRGVVRRKGGRYVDGEEWCVEEGGAQDRREGVVFRRGGAVSEGEGWFTEGRGCYI
jgi:hypothetical protein